MTILEVAKLGSIDGETESIRNYAYTLRYLFANSNRLAIMDRLRPLDNEKHFVQYATCGQKSASSDKAYYWWVHWSDQERNVSDMYSETDFAKLCEIAAHIKAVQNKSIELVQQGQYEASHTNAVDRIPFLENLVEHVREYNWVEIEAQLKEHGYTLM